MKRRTLKQTIVTLVIALAASMSFIASVSAENVPFSTSSPTADSKESLEAKRKLLEERQQKIDYETLEVITGTQNALMALQKKDSNKAMTLLQDVSGKLDILLAKYPSLTLLPARVEADVYDLDNDAKQVQKLIDDADKLLKHHRVQEARYILDGLVSEMRITTTNIPLGTFPAAIKDAARLIDKGKMKEAEDALHDVLNTMVKTTEIVSLPVLRAEALLSKAAELEHKSDLSKEASRTEILKLTNEAKDKLKLAEILGYGDKDDYKVLYNTIDDLKEVIHSEKSEAVWNKIKNSLSDFKNKIIHPKK